MLEHEERVRLATLIGQTFNEEDLKNLCFRLPDLDYENLPGEGRQGKIRELVEFARRHNMEDQLLGQLRALRPKAAWPEQQAPQADDSLPTSPPFSQLQPGDKKVKESVDRLAWMFAVQDRDAEPILPSGILPEIGRLFRRYTFCEAPEECDTQVWTTRLLAIVETHAVLAALDRYLFRAGLQDQEEALGTVRSNLIQVANALRDYGQAQTAYFGPALDWQEATSRRETDGYEALWNDLKERQLPRDGLSETVRQRCNEAFWHLRQVVDGFEALQATC
jgi:hypothetical protein